MEATHLQRFIYEYIGTVIYLYVIITTGNAFIIGGTLIICLLVGKAIFKDKFNNINFNPAVSIMMSLAKKMSLRDLAPYIFCQIAGGITALVIYKYIK